jgi:hypothetical protein
LTQDLDLDGNATTPSLTLHVAIPITFARREIAEHEVKVDVNDRVNLYVAVKLKVRVDVEVVVEVHDPVKTARGALFYPSC